MKHYPISLVLGLEKKYLIQRFHGNGILTIFDYRKMKKDVIMKLLKNTNIRDDDAILLLKDIDKQIQDLEIQELKLIQELDEPPQVQPIQNRNYLSIEIPQLQKVITIGEINIINGYQGSGKTSLLWKIMLSNPIKFIYLDFNAQLNFRRIKQVLQSILQTKQKIDQFLSNIQYRKIFDCEDLENYMGTWKQNSFVIIDGYLLSIFVTEDDLEASKNKVHQISKQFRKLCRQRNITFIIANTSEVGIVDQFEHTDYDQFILPYASSVISLTKDIDSKRVLQVNMAPEGQQFEVPIYYTINDNGFVFSKY
ncbi:hypothetical protein pb186bvf_005239 [Paramecium bursaria]